MTVLTQIATSPLIRDLHRPFVTALRSTTQVISVAVRVTDSDGVSGYAEAPQIWRVTGESLASITACIQGPLAEALLGLRIDDDPLDLQARLAGAVAGNTGARAAVEIAVLDLLARRRKLSFAAAIGAQSGSVASDITIAAQVEDAGGERVPDGFTTAKVKVGLDPADVQRVIRIQREAGESVRLRVDANQAWDVPTTVANVEAWQAAGVSLDFIEQPLPSWDLAGHAELRRRLTVPVMLDESIFSVHDLACAIDREAADLINIKLAKCGGIGAGLEIARLARKADLGVMVGSMMESELGVSAAAALAATIAPVGTHDLDAAWWSIDTEADTQSPYQGGHFRLSSRSGLSSAVDRCVSPDARWQVRDRA